jgi:hypothetical protein
MKKKIAKTLGSSNNDTALAKILDKFDKADKTALALELVREFDLRINGDPYINQLKSILDRELSDDEKFKIDILDRMLRFHSGGGGGGRFGVADISPKPPPLR